MYQQLLPLMIYVVVVYLIIIIMHAQEINHSLKSLFCRSKNCDDL